MEWKIRVGLVLSLLCSATSWPPSKDLMSSLLKSEEPPSLQNVVNEFGYNLLNQMTRQKENSNVVVSPTGVAGLLAMTLLGSAGGSYDELSNVLGFSQDIVMNRKDHESLGQLFDQLNVNDTTSKTLYADAIFVDVRTRLRDVFRLYMKRVYHGEALTADFKDTGKAKELINDWVQNHTEGKIAEFLKRPLPIDTQVVLVSALYFSGQWAQPFYPEGTRKMEFKRPSGEVLADLMLNAGKFDYIFSKSDGIQLVKFPYNDNVTNMYVLKPRLHKKLNLSEAMDHLSYAKIDQLISQMKKTECVIRFPKMEIKSTANLEKPLTALGVKSMFTPGESNLALMIDDTRDVNSTDELLPKIHDEESEVRGLKAKIDSLPNPGIYVDTVLHDVKITINEFGTEAVAATGGILARTAELFYVDSPFYMFIRNERTKLVTFSAVVYDPTEE